MDPAPSPVDNATLGTPRRKRSTRKAAKTSPYFASRKGGLAKTSDTKQRENKGSGKKIKTLYVDESDEDGCSSKKKSEATDKSTKKPRGRNQSVALKSISHPVKNHLKMTVLMDRRHHQVMMMILMRQISRTVMALI